MHSFNPLGLFALSSLLFVIVGIFLIPLIFYCLTLQKCLNRCSLENRAMSPGLVWLLFVPVFHFVWHFIIVLKISDSLAKEFQRRNIPSEPEPGKTLGLAYSILDVCAIIPIIGFLPGIAGLICWIMYWVKIANYSAQIAVPFTAAGQTV